MSEKRKKLPKLNWIPGHHDDRSKNFRYFGAAPGRVELRYRRWQTGPVLDQGREGACVGYGWTNELTAAPYSYQDRIAGEAQAFAHRLYLRARASDRQLGWRFPEGATVLGGARAVQQLGFIGEYRWCMNMDELKAAVVVEGPVVIGVPWYSGMYATRKSGMVEVSGNVVGGHCLTIVGYHPGMRIAGEGWHDRHEVFIWVNSWGPDYGLNGIGYVRAGDLAALLRNQGEACVPMKRRAITRLDM